METQTPVIIINDCRDANASGRQAARAGSLIGPVHLIGVGSDLEAAGNLIDVLDALDDRPGVILVNVAPRSGAAHKWPNGTPFSYFRYRNALVLASIDGYTLSLVKKLGLVDSVTVLEVPKSVEQMATAGAISHEEAAKIAASQFRSFDFLPRAAAFLARGGTIVGDTLSMADVPDAPLAVWWVDNFGNCKTTLLPEEVGYAAGKSVETVFGQIPCIPSLKDVSDGQTAFTIGSSGLGSKRFLELVVQGVSEGSAAGRFGIHSGAQLT